MARSLCLAFLAAAIPLACDASSATQGSSDTSVALPDADTTLATDPCDPNPCTEPPDPICDYARTSVAAASDPGSCSVVDGAARCSYAPVHAPCAEGPCLLDACRAIAGKCAWPYTDRVSFISGIHFASDAPCCHDDDGDGVADNRFGEVLADIAPVIGDIDAYLADQIDSHRATLLLDLMGVDDPDNDAQVDVIGYESNFDNVAFVDPKTGLAEMKLKLASFLDEQGLVPRVRFRGRIEGGHLIARDGRFAFVLLGAEDAPTELVIDHAGIDAELSLGPNGHGFIFDGDGGRGARLWGEVARDSFLASLNAEFEHGCTCAVFGAGASGPIDVAANACNAAVENTCDTDGAPLCQALADQGLCAVLLTLLEPDLDSDGDGVLDAMSVGFHFHATSARVAWIESCPGAPVP